MKIAIIGGTFNDGGGRPSKILGKAAQEISSDDHHIFTIINGGHYANLPGIISLLSSVDIICWFVSVPNDKPKVRDIKKLYPDKILITSKRNLSNQYPFSSLINHALGLKSNLLFEVSTFSNLLSERYYARVIDPLANVWCDYTEDFGLALHAAVNRAVKLSQFTRLPSLRVTNSESHIPNEPEFFELIKYYAEVFHDLINPEKEVVRFLGNASFRCQRGFPSFRGPDKLIYVSRRNIDKRFIGREGFVGTYLNRDGVHYYGEHKPSVDAPVQLRLYGYYLNVNYMIHSHTYVENVPFTAQMIPCGALEEFDEIIKSRPDMTSSNFAINLRGHGSLVLAEDVDYLKNIHYISRPCPEFC
jgi:hypothetical protein